LKGWCSVVPAPYRSLPTSPFFPHSRPILTVFGEYPNSVRSNIKSFKCFGHYLSETNKSYPFYLTNDPHRVTIHTGVNDLSHQHQRSSNEKHHHRHYHLPITHPVPATTKPTDTQPLPTQTIHSHTANGLHLDNAIGLHIHQPTLRH